MVKPDKNSFRASLDCAVSYYDADSKVKTKSQLELALDQEVYRSHKTVCKLTDDFCSMMRSLNMYRDIERQNEELTSQN